MSNKLKIKGLGSLELPGEVPKLGKDYLLSIVVERSGKHTDEKDKDDPIDIYIMDYNRTEMLMEIGDSKKIEVSQGRTQSQKLRFVIHKLARLKGVDEDDFYKSELSKIINHYSDKLE